MLLEVVPITEAGTVTSEGASFGICGLKDTPQIVAAAKIEDAITISRVVGHDPGPVANSDARMSKYNENVRIQPIKSRPGSFS